MGWVKSYVTKHNPTIGVLTEEIIRSFLKSHLPNLVSVEQGFVINEKGELSKQCDILIYDSQSYAPLYRINDIVIVPSESVLAVIEVKTTINKKFFHGAIDFFKSFDCLPNAKKYLFIFNSKNIKDIGSYLHSYKHEGDYQLFDHDSFQFLPDEITGINKSYHLRKDGVIACSDMIGYSSWFYEDLEGSEINALQHFYSSVSSLTESYIHKIIETLKRKIELATKK
ncbi:DUF6602 domain-containing protein [Allochromatium vinosum]|uniref:DUF6602 domain-containing protein n=1 Tax=Allochromatium vinosum (strain ATCC 17899 / DSM 180 / NBRC 103801 / NCIMB 10441 / D) TaxID=572477 RepID=D3RS93_ALLVD|nr:DUF6602 domain-containing protein [Allochromatium vinosum]ADC62052.1 hypothetical protein Alvin_1113 [Allochromatium vinosum DSM 180]